MAKFGVTIRVNGSMRIEVEAENPEQAEDMVWDQIGEDAENLDFDEFEFTDVDVRAYSTSRGAL